MITLLFDLLLLAAWLYQIVLVIYLVLSFVRPGQSAITQFFNRIVEPVLAPLRRILAKVLPAQWNRMDWSPVAAWILLWVLRQLLGLLRAILV